MRGQAQVGCCILGSPQTTPPRMPKPLSKLSRPKFIPSKTWNPFKYHLFFFFLNCGKSHIKHTILTIFNYRIRGFPHSSVGKESICNAGDPGSIPGLGRSAGEGIIQLPTPVFLGFPCSSADKESACDAGDLGLIPGLGRAPGEGKGYPTPVFWPREFHGL